MKALVFLYAMMLAGLGTGVVDVFFAVMTPPWFKRWWHWFPFCAVIGYIKYRKAWRLERKRQARYEV